MPFGKGSEFEFKERESKFIFEDIIKPSVKNALDRFNKSIHNNDQIEIEVVRELEESKAGNITEEIVKKIFESYITIVDITGKNPNVFMELGIRYALKRNGTILLAQNTEKIPFNIRNYRIVQYDPKFDGAKLSISLLSNTIYKTLEALNDTKKDAQFDNPLYLPTDSLVYQAIPELNISSSKSYDYSQKLPWTDYWYNVTRIADNLQTLKSQGIYNPDILIGISNGGLLLADSLLRLSYANEIPLISLWAQRSKGDMLFDNITNNSLINNDTFKRFLKNSKTKTLNVLILDDIVGTSNTFHRLLKYINSKLDKDLLEKIKLNFIFLYTADPNAIEATKKYLLTEDKKVRNFNLYKFENLTSHNTLPYDKNIHHGDIQHNTGKTTSNK